MIRITRESPRVAVRLVDGSTMLGRQRRRGWRCLYLTEARLHQDRGEPTPMDGEVVLERRSVLWVQYP